MTAQVYIGLGSNLEQPQEQIRLAAAELKKLPDSRYITDSGLFLSKPMIDDATLERDQPDYYNAVVLIETTLEPILLLDLLQGIERAQGRERNAHWGPRTIDLDILLYGQEEINNDRLQIPHSGICEREFVLYPLQRLNPEIQIPGHGMLEHIIKTCPENGMRYVGEIE